MLKSYDKIKPSLYISSILIALSLLSSAVLSSSSSSADVVDDVVVTVPISCNMSSELDEAHTATINPGQYQSDIGTTNFTVFCNDNSGYAIYAIGYSNEEYGNTKMLATINNELSPTNDISTGTNTGGNTSSWSMKLVPVTTASSGTEQPYTPTIESDTSGSFSNYHTVPAEYTKVATFTSNTDFTIGSSLQSTYQVYIDGTKPAGTYTGKVKYTLVHPSDHATPDEFTSETLQSVTNWGGKVAPGQTVTVTDTRDGQEYTVARLADGKLWMTKNLRLDIGRANITAENTNNPTQAFLTAISNASSSNEWCTDDNSTCTDQIKYNTSNINDPTTDSEGHKYDEYGVYYNWYTATAGNGTYSTTSNTNVSGDICPSGWHLPTGTDTSVGSPNAWTGDYWNLAAAQDGGIASDNGNYSTITSATGSERLRSSPNNFLYSGYFADSSVFSRGEAGQYWSSTKQYSPNAYLLDIRSSSLIPGHTAYPTFTGKSIRCVTEQGPYGFDTALANAGKTKHNDYYKIQDANSSICSAVAEGQEIDLIDERDNEVYKVAKLADGNCWMLENLRLDPTNPTTAANMNASNTNATQDAIDNLLHGGSTTAGWSNVAVADIDADFYRDGCTVPRINNASKDTLVTSYGPASTNGQAKVGVYYNYCAASASTYCYADSQGIDKPDTLIDADQDICPANWKMPTGGNAGEYYNLAQRYSSYAEDTNSLQFNFSTPLSGSYRESSASYQDHYGYWWSSTYDDNSHMYHLEVFPKGLYHASYYRHYGQPMRCLVNK